MKFLFSMIIAAVIAVAVIALIGWKRAPEAIANEMSKKLKVNVEIGGINGDINHVFIDNFQIDNPSGSILAQAFSCERIEMNASVPNFLEQDIVIEEINIDQPYFDFEFDRPKSKKGNWSTIMNNAHDSKSDMKNEMQGKSDPCDATRTVLIRHLVLKKITTDLVYRNKHQVKRMPAIDEIVLNDLKSEGGSVTSQVFKLVFSQSIKAIFEELDIKHDLPGGHARYLLPLRRLSSHLFQIENEKEDKKWLYDHHIQDPNTFSHRR